MSKISRIRIMNLNYNNNTMKIDDETFDLGGESTLLSLRNGGGKSVLVQMIVSLFVNRSYRDFGDRAFRSYFTTNRPTFIMTEWQLDNNSERFLAGMMVRRNQKEDNENEDLEMYTFTGSYTGACRYDLDNLALIRTEGNRRILRGFTECRNLFEALKKEQEGDFNYYDMSGQYGRTQYFKLLRQYQINHKEWESIIRKVNQKESGLSELFQNAKDERNLVENWFLRPIEDKLNQDKNKMEEFRKLTYQFIELYQKNQSGISRKAVIEQYFEETKPLEEMINEYVQLYEEREDARREMIFYVKLLKEELERLSAYTDGKKEELSGAEADIRRILYEQISCQIYKYEDEKNEVTLERIDSETEITRNRELTDRLLREMNAYDCSRLYAELKDLEADKAQLEERMAILVQQSEDSAQEIEEIGHRLYVYYHAEERSMVQQQEKKQEELKNAQDAHHSLEESKLAVDAELKQRINSIGSLEQAVSSYDEVEEEYNHRYQSGLGRNLLGLYEDGTLEVLRRQQDAELQQERNVLAVNSRRKMELETAYKKLEQEAESNSTQIALTDNRIEILEKELDALRQQREKRLLIMKYVEVPEQDVDNKPVILAGISGRIKELDIRRNRLIGDKTACEKQYRQLKEGKTIELPEHIREYFEQNAIEILYGMEWLAKNRRGEKENAALVENNPFLPYALIMERTSFERFRNMEEELYTTFPIPILIRDELEQKITMAEGHVTTLETIHFFIKFNQHLLNKTELEKMLAVLQNKVHLLENDIARIDEELDTYRSYRSCIEEQTYTGELYERTGLSLKEAGEEKEQLESRRLEIRSEKEDNSAKGKECNRLIEKNRETIQAYENRSHVFDRLYMKYRQYETNVTTLARVCREKKALEGKYDDLRRESAELLSEIEGLRDTVKQYADEIEKIQNKCSVYACYQNHVAESHVVFDEFQTPQRLEARYDALTKEAADTLEELQKRLDTVQSRLSAKTKELQKRNKYEIPVEEYRTLIFSDEVYDGLEKKRIAAEKAGNAAIERNQTLNARMEHLNTAISYTKKELFEKTGYEEPALRQSIVESDFEERKKLREYDAQVLRTQIRSSESRQTLLKMNVAAMAEYDGAMVAVTQEQEEEIRNRIPDLAHASDKEFNAYQGKCRQNFSSIGGRIGKCRRELDRTIRTIAGNEHYKEDSFKKPFDSLLAQIEEPYSLSEQYRLNLQSYQRQLEKLKVDLEHVDDEQKNLEEMFLEYICAVNANIAMIDKNSTINVRNRSIKMLKILVPDWEIEKEHYRIKLHDYFETIIRLGLDAIRKNENLNELLGNVITTRQLYDDIVGISAIKIKLYKIEAEREVPISWAEVSANSGGEGFLSAFVILTCLLGYMRRDENALFSSGEEGKVLIMDNPFAQTNAEHLLKPLMEMAKKTNTQLICLSGLGGDSIYNRFDNIYVLKLVDSNIRNGVKRIESSHLKGEDIDRLVLSQFKLEKESV